MPKKRAKKAAKRAANKVANAFGFQPIEEGLSSGIAAEGRAATAASELPINFANIGARGTSAGIRMTKEVKALQRTLRSLDRFALRASGRGKVSRIASKKLANGIDSLVNAIYGKGIKEVAKEASIKGKPLTELVSFLRSTAKEGQVGLRAVKALEEAGAAVPRTSFFGKLLFELGSSAGIAGTAVGKLGKATSLLGPGIGAAVGLAFLAPEISDLVKKVRGIPTDTEKANMISGRALRAPIRRAASPIEELARVNPDFLRIINNDPELAVQVTQGLLPVGRNNKVLDQPPVGPPGSVFITRQ